MTDQNDPWTPERPEADNGPTSPPAAGPHGPHEFPAAPPVAPGSEEPPHHHGADPWAFDHDANQASQVWGSAPPGASHTSELHYTAVPVDQPGSKKPLLIVAAIMVAVAVIAGVAVWYFLRDSGVFYKIVTEPEQVTLDQYVDEVCDVYGHVGEESAAFELEIQARVTSMGDVLTTPKDELLDFSQDLLYDVVDYARGIGMRFWNLNENHVVDHPDGEDARQGERGRLTAFFRDLDDIEEDIDNLTPEMSDRAIGEEFERIALKVESLFTPSRAATRPAGDVEAVIDSRGGECVRPN